ncbi:MAG: 2-oxoacid:acceptor oxidoreductase family protein [Planctomycetota bacterium]|jgi:2-oxoglutarate ferredoxin oxidoreductase subunit gamma
MTGTQTNATSTEVLMAGFGGQGMLLAGKILARAAMETGLEVSWLPSYGPEMRGGTANVIVCVAPEPIGSPLITTPRGLVAMNKPSLEKFAPKVKAGGLIVYNATLIDTGPERDDCTVFAIDSRDVAEAAGNKRAANFVMLGAWAGASSALDPAALEAAIEHEFTGPKAKFVPANIAAFRAGMEAVR